MNNDDRYNYDDERSSYGRERRSYPGRSYNSYDEYDEYDDNRYDDAQPEDEDMGVSEPDVSEKFRDFMFRIKERFSGLKANGGDGDDGKKPDKKNIIIMAACAFLILIIIIGVGYGVKNRHKKVKPVESKTIADTTEMPTFREKQPAGNNQENSVGEYTVKLGDGLENMNMRQAASSESPIISLVPNGTKITVLFIDDSALKAGKQDYAWGYAEYNGQRGWLCMDYLKK